MRFNISRFFIITISLIIFNFKSYTQLNQGNCPNNIDFEFGNFTNWKLAAGLASPGPNYAWNTFTQVAGQHEILSAVNNAGQTDPYGNFPVVCPNGSGYSIKLGNNVTGRGAERVSYTFTIPNGAVQYSITYYYAVVFQNPTHVASQQPRFTVNLLDINTNATVGCSFYDYAASSNLPGFQLSTLGTATNPVYYKTWTPVTIDLSGLNGKTLTLEFITNDCTQGGHFGYGYVDVGATCITPVTGYAYCLGANSVTLTAPFGYQNYYWYDQNYGVTLGSNQTLVISPPPANGTVYNLDLVPFPTFGCRDTLSVTMEEQIPPDTPVAQTIYSYCQNTPSTQLTATSLPGYLLQWYTVPIGGTPSTTAPTPSTTTLGSTDYYVSQLSFGGCEGDRKKITVNIEQPVNANFSINDTLQCLGGNVFQFTNTSTLVGTGTTFGWDFGDLTPQVFSNNATHTYSTIGTYTVKLTAVKGLCVTFKTIIVDVVASPVAAFSFVSACEGQPISFNNNTTGGSINNVYTWDFGGQNSSSLTSPTYTFANAGTYNVSLTATEGACTHTETKQVLVYAVPKTNFVYSPACVNDSIQFSDITTLTNGSISSWAWDFGNGQTSNLQNPKMAFNTNGSQNIKLTASTPTCSKDTTIIVTVFEKPNAKFNRIDTACLNQLVQFKDASNFTTGAPSTGITGWWWSTGNGNIYASQNVNPTYNSLTNYEVQQVVYSAEGCKSDTNKVMVNVRNLPVAVPTILSPLCENRGLLFDDLSTPNISSRIWNFSTGANSTVKSPVVNNFTMGLQNLRLTVTDSFGCKSKPSDSNFIINKRPDIAFDYLDSCLDRTIPFLAIDADVSYVTQWMWTFEGNTISGVPTQNHQFSKHGANEVSLYAVAFNGCISDTLTKTINIKHTPAFAGEDVKTTINEPKQLSASGGISYSWSPVFGLDNPAIQNPIVTTNIDRLYTVTVTSLFGCKSYDEVKVTIYKGPDIYVPNIFTPNNDGVNDMLIITPIGIKEYKGIKVFNRFGKIVFESTNPLISWNGKLLDKWADNGTYVFIAEGVDINGKKIVQKGTVILIR